MTAFQHRWWQHDGFWGERVDQMLLPRARRAEAATEPSANLTLALKRLGEKLLDEPLPPHLLALLRCGPD